MHPESGIVVQSLESALRDGSSSLANVPGLLKRLLREGMWQEFVTPRGETVTYERFEDFVTTPPTKGLGATIELVRDVVARDVEALDALDQAMKREPGGDTRSTKAQTNVYNVHNERPAGNAEARALRKLRKDAPELHREVLKGNLSAHAAMVQAGYRKRTITVPIDPQRAAATLKRHLDEHQLKELLTLLQQP